jgi:hypothetical protein
VKTGLDERERLGRIHGYNQGGNSKDPSKQKQRYTHLVLALKCTRSGNGGCPPLQPSKPGTQRANKIVRAHDFLWPLGMPRCTWYFTCASERSVLAHVQMPCGTHTGVPAHVRRHVPSGYVLLHKIFMRAHDNWSTPPTKIGQSQRSISCMCTCTLALPLPHFHPLPVTVSFSLE